MNTYYSNGKLLLTGEYLVLDGALALALPTRFGQSLSVKPIDTSILSWKSFDYKNELWFEDEFNLKFLNSAQPNHEAAKRILQILGAAKQLNPEFLNTKGGFEATMYMDFPKYWGLGSSSTLINNISDWSKVDAYKLLELTFSGSGYDIACAQNKTPITYKLTSDKREVTQVNFNPEFKSQLFFVYLNKKQDSRDAISQYQSNEQDHSNIISEINEITLSILETNSLNDFIELINKHESIISKVINQETIKSQFFSDFNGAIKSLGAWGGDFVLAASSYNPTSYFKEKGYKIILPYHDMILSS